ncbi:MAG: hypothetical protein R3E44_02310 [Paracoccaceae bacterium]
MSRLRTILSLGALALTPALPAHAGGKFAPPKGCEVYVTVQMRSCQVSHHYRCAGSDDGDQWAAYLDGEGPFYVSRIDAETRWMESWDLITGETDKLLSEADPASFTVLLNTGRDDYDFRTESSTGEIRRFAGFDELTGETVVIDGVPLEVTKFDLTAYSEDGTMIWRRTGNQFISREWRIFWSDKELFENAAGDKVDTLSTPVKFEQPGDKGFLAAEPVYDCEAMMTEAQAAARPKDGS